MSSNDTTRTLSLERRYARRLRAGFRRINTAIREGVEKSDRLGLNVDPVPDFTFPRDDRKIREFQRWLDSQMRKEVLTQVSENENRYVHQAYSRGVKNADIRSRRAGIDVPNDNIHATLALPIHRDKLQLIYTRNYSLLEGITDDVSKEISRVMSDGLAQGVGPDEMSRMLRGSVSDIGVNRSNMMGRTETLYSHNEGSLNRYEQHGIEKVEVLTSDPCPRCASFAAGGPYQVSEVKSYLPFHPNCRCSWSPVVDT